MRFGLRKLTLLDFPGVVGCTVFTPGCNFRCPFCHNASLVHAQEPGGLLSEEELFTFLRRRQGILDGVCITGGEPMLHPELPELMEKIRALGYQLKLDTNGSFPERLQNVLERRLADYVAMDVKNAPAKYAMTAGNDSVLAAVRQSVALLMGGDTPFEFRTTVAGGFHTAEDFAEIGKWIAGAPRYFLQKFTDSGDLLAPAPGMDALTDADLEAFLAAVKPYVPAAEIRGSIPLASGHEEKK